MKRIGFFILALALFGAGFAATAATADKVVIKMAGMKPESEPETLGMHKFGEILTQLSNDKYEVQVFPNSQLGKKDNFAVSE